MNPRLQIGLALMISAGVLGGIGVVNHFTVLAGEPYEMSVVKSNLVLALDTHNIEAKVGYIDSTVAMLQPYSGNSQWWYPTHVSDIDQTRALLQTVSDDVKAQLGVKERDQYFILPHNELVTYMNSEINKSALRLDSYANGAYWNPSNNVISYIVTLGAFPLFIIGLVFAIASDSYGYQRKLERQAEEKRNKERKEERERTIQAEADRRNKMIEENAKQGKTLPKGF